MLAIEGRSAGGLLMGAVLNMAPQLFRAAVAGVPFVDIMVTMADPSIPLTVGEWCVSTLPLRKPLGVSAVAGQEAGGSRGLGMCDALRGTRRTGRVP